MLVTGAAGFIGSHLCDTLIASGDDDVVGIDCFTPYYDTGRKRANVSTLLEAARFRFVDDDLLTADLDALLDGVDVVFHLAAQPGVRHSWANGFALYDQLNIALTQRLLEAARRQGALARFVLASSSSVYGRAESYPTREEVRCQPQSPYGVTKLAAEGLLGAYAHSFGVPAIALRYFTVYGPRQRPDMAMSRLIDAAAGGDRFPLFGSGEQIRDFTFVADVVSATLAAARADVVDGSAVNIAGGETATVREVIALVEELTGRTVAIDQREGQAGDVSRTGGDVSRAAEWLGWKPTVTLRDGLAAQVEWCAAH